MSSRAITGDYQQIIKESVLQNEDFLKATFSGQSREKACPWIKITVRPVLLRGQKHHQFSYFDARKDITKNYFAEESAEKLADVLAFKFKNVRVQNVSRQFDITLNQKGRASIRETLSAGQGREASLSHDRQKQIILTSADAAPFLKAVGIMTDDGRIKADMQSKFRQINAFLQLVQQMGDLKKTAHSPLYAVDCGCGNAYLTFAFYHYLNNVLALPTNLTGIDVNAPLVTGHQEKSARLDWPGLTFQSTSIIDFQPPARPDIVLALHACDTATDEALAQGIGWQSTFIISAPCCQHHLQEQIDHRPTPTPFKPIERHSILKERLGDILTDALRALILRIMGYQTDVVQFVSSEHTAKNLLIRAVKTLPVGDPQFIQEYQELKQFWQVTPYLEELLGADFAALLATANTTSERTEQLGV